jgi:hypothetical protein
VCRAGYAVFIDEEATMADVTLQELLDAISEVDFPAHKDEIVRSAEQEGASVDAQQALRSMPPVEYANGDEVIRSVNVDIGSRPAESVRADPSNKPDQPGVTERLR